MGETSYLTMSERRPVGYHSVGIPISRLQNTRGEGVETYRELVEKRDAWIRKSLGRVIFQADYHSGIAYFHFENPNTAFEFKIRWG